jgi:hypothetical protein
MHASQIRRKRLDDVTPTGPSGSSRRPVAVKLPTLLISVETQARGRIDGVGG